MQKAIGAKRARGYRMQTDIVKIRADRIDPFGNFGISGVYPRKGCPGARMTGSGRWGMAIMNILILAALIIMPADVLAAVIFVPDDYQTIQEAIDAAADGDTITVRPGTYTETIDFKGKALHIMGKEGPARTVIDGNASGSVVNFINGETANAVLEGFTITNGTGTFYTPFFFGGGINCDGSAPTITGNVITANSAYSGGGILCYNFSAPALLNNVISGNSADEFGGGVYCSRSTATIAGNIIEHNLARKGGGITCAYYGGDVVIRNNVIQGNSAVSGAGVHCYIHGEPSVINCTITGNTATESGGGLYCDIAGATVVNSIFWGNEAETGSELGAANYSSLRIGYSDVRGGLDDVFLDAESELIWGLGMLEADPLFVAGRQGENYLSQVSAGQSIDSPCVESGGPESEVPQGTTRTDDVQDVDIVDMGYHYSALPVRLIIAPGPGNANPSRIRVFPPEQNAAHVYEFSPYGVPRFGNNVTCADVNGDGRDEIIAGAGPGAACGPHVRGFQAAGEPVQGLNFLAYGTPGFGVNVAGGDLDGDGKDEIITGAGPGAIYGPHVRGWNHDGSTTVTPIPEVNFLAYGTNRWGVNVASGDIDGDGFDEIITGAGPGACFGSHVRAWNVDCGMVSPVLPVNFIAYSTGRYGVMVGCGDLDGDGIDEMVTAPGPGIAYGAHIKGWNHDGIAVAPLPGFSFLAWQPSENRYGARVFAGADLNSDGLDELMVGGGPDPESGTPVKVFLYDGKQVKLWFSLQAYPEDYAYGSNVAAGLFNTLPGQGARRLLPFLPASE